MTDQQRTYRSPLRAAQVEQTRRLLLEAATELLAESGADELNIRQVALRAQISVPTAYRYFPSRDELLDAVGDWINEQMGFTEYPDSLQSAPAFAGVLYRGFARHETLVRAQLANPLGREIRQRAVSRRTALIRESVARSLPGVPADVQADYAALIHLLLSTSAWTHLRERWNLDADRIARLSGWALSTLVEAILHDPPALARYPDPSDQPYLSDQPVQE